MAVFEMRNARKAFGLLEVLKGVSLKVEKGEVVSIIGPSGGGKSTMLRCATLLETMDSGTLAYGENVAAREENGKSVYAGKAALAQVRRQFGLVFQQFDLFPHYTVLKNVCDAPISVQKRDRAEVEAEAMALLDKMGLKGKENAYPYQLSGGQQQRVAIARALAMKPEILFFDEPTSALDPLLTGEVLRVIRNGLEGPVLGVEAERMNGRRLFIRARRGVVVATGGFGANAELVGRFAPRLGHLRSTNLPGTTGDLIAPLEDIGAAAVGMDFFQLLPGSAEDGRFIGAASTVERMIFVNRAGERFIAEDSPSSKLSAAVLAQPGGIAFPILDANGYSAMRTLSRAMFDRALMRGDAFEANSIPELASLLQIPAEALVATVEAYNEAVETGHDPVGRRAVVLMHRIARRPFYGAKVTMCVNCTLGGIAITPRAEVLDRHGRVITRLYAAGEVTGGVHGANYMGGNALSDVFTFGRIAGENAVQEPFA